MEFIKPMLAKNFPGPKKPLSIRPGEWVAEEKYDGHRLIVAKRGEQVRAWSRYGLPRILSPNVIEDLKRMPDGVYDGELIIPGQRSYNVVEVTNHYDLVFCVFDVLRIDYAGLTGTFFDVKYKQRRALLEDCVKVAALEAPLRGVQLAWAKPLTCLADAESICQEVWARDGEGLILKNVNSLYVPGGRSANTFIKMKNLRSATVTILGFKEGLNGPYARVWVEDEDGFRTTVKTLNNRELARAAANPQFFIGKKLLIEYQERTPDGNYRHPRWDRLEDE